MAGVIFDCRIDNTVGGEVDIVLVEGLGVEQGVTGPGLAGSQAAAVEGIEQGQRGVGVFFHDGLGPVQLGHD